MSISVPLSRENVNAAVQADVPPKTARPIWASDLALYVLLTLLVLGAWQFSRLGLFRAGDDIGYWLGVAGGVIMLLLLVYPMRKYIHFMRNWGAVKWWFWVHMTLGVLGPMLILIHSTFRIGSVNAGVALYSMIIVALSGVVGRFLYTRIHRGLHGERSTLMYLQSRAGLAQTEAKSKLRFAPKVEERLLQFEDYALKAPPSWGTAFRQVTLLPLQQVLTYRQCMIELRGPLRAVARHRRWTPEDNARRERLSKKLVRRYLSGVVRVAQFSAYERLFALWHVAHVPFVYLLAASAVAHVIAVHAY
jgi:hypothetical protein